MSRSSGSSYINQPLRLSFEEDIELRFSNDDENHKPMSDEVDENEEIQIEKEKQAECFGYMELALRPLIEKEVKKVLLNTTFSNVNDIRQELFVLRKDIREIHKKSEKKWDALKKEGAEVYDNVRAASQKFFSTTQECFNDIENNFKKSETNMMFLIKSLSQRLDDAYEKLKVLDKVPEENPVNDMSLPDQTSSMNLQKRFSVNKVTNNRQLEQISEIVQQQKKFEEILHQLRTDQENILARIHQQEQKNSSQEYFSQEQSIITTNEEDGSSMCILNNSISTIDTFCSTIESPEPSKTQKEISVSFSSNNVDTDMPYGSEKEIDLSSTEKTKHKAISMDGDIKRSKRGQEKREEEEKKKKRKKRQEEESKNDKEENRAPKTRNKQRKTRTTFQEKEESEISLSREERDKVSLSREQQIEKKSIRETPSKKNDNIAKILLKLIDPTSISAKKSVNMDDIILPDTFTFVVSELTAAFKGVIKVSSCKAYISKYLRSVGYSLSTTTKSGDTFINATKKATN